MAGTHIEESRVVALENNQKKMMGSLAAIETGLLGSIAPRKTGLVAEVDALKKKDEARSDNNQWLSRLVMGFLVILVLSQAVQIFLFYNIAGGGLQ